MASSPENCIPLVLARQIPTPYLLNHVLWLEAQAEAADSTEAQTAYWDAYERLVEILRGVTSQEPLTGTGPVRAEVFEITAQPGPAESNVGIAPVPSLRLRVGSEGRVPRDPAPSQK